MGEGFFEIWNLAQRKGDDRGGCPMKRNHRPNAAARDCEDRIINPDQRHAEHLEENHRERPDKQVEKVRRCENSPEINALCRIPQRVLPQALRMAVSSKPRYKLSSSRLVVREKKMIPNKSTRGGN